MLTITTQPLKGESGLLPAYDSYQQQLREQQYVLPPMCYHFRHATRIIPMGIPCERWVLGGWDSKANAAATAAA